MLPVLDDFFLADVHRHRRPGPEKGFFLRNAFHFLDAASISSLSYPVSAGLHPMHTPLWTEEVKARLNTVWQLPGVLAIGECGLDSRFPDTAGQQRVFSWQVAQANQLKKPLILHLVRSDVPALRIVREAKVPFVLHGFRGKPDRLRFWLDHPGAWFSFGWALAGDPHTRDSFLLCPPDRILLETDADPHTIGQVYTVGARLLGMEDHLFQGLVCQNAKRFFGLNRLPIFDPS